jgi:predicted ester cyclase
VNGGMLVGVPPTGRHFEVQHIHLMQVRGGKIVEHFANRDDLGMMKQLGLLPTPDSDVKR